MKGQAMTKKQLQKRIEELERRIVELEMRPVIVPAPQPWSPYYAPNTTPIIPPWGGTWVSC